MLLPQGEGTILRSPGQDREVRNLLDGGMTLREAVIPYTAPQRAEQLLLFQEN